VTRGLRALTIVLPPYGLESAGQALHLKESLT